MSPEFVSALSRGLVIGIFGGAAIVLTQLYSRRGPMIYPVYAAILFVLALFLTRVTPLGFGERVIVVFAAIFLSTLMSFVATLVLAARARRQLLASGRELAPGHVPAWGLPLVLFILVAVSTGVAFVSS